MTDIDTTSDNHGDGNVEMTEPDPPSKNENDPQKK